MLIRIGITQASSDKVENLYMDSLLLEKCPFEEPKIRSEFWRDEKFGKLKRIDKRYKYDFIFNFPATIEGKVEVWTVKECRWYSKGKYWQGKRSSSSFHYSYSNQ